MRSGQCGFLLFLSIVAGCIGGTISMSVMHRVTFPTVLLPSEVYVRKGLGIINSDGQRRALLEKSKLTLFTAYGEPDTVLDSHGGTLRLYNETWHRSVQVSANSPYIIQFAQTAARHTFVTLPTTTTRFTEVQLGIALKDGLVVWNIPEQQISSRRPHE